MSFSSRVKTSTNDIDGTENCSKMKDPSWEIQEQSSRCRPNRSVQLFDDNNDLTARSELEPGAKNVISRVAHTQIREVRMTSVEVVKAMNDMACLKEFNTAEIMWQSINADTKQENSQQEPEKDFIVNDKIKMSKKTKI